MIVENAPELPFPIVRPTFQRPIILGSPSRFRGLGSSSGEFASVMLDGQFSEDERDGYRSSTAEDVNMAIKRG